MYETFYKTMGGIYL